MNPAVTVLEVHQVNKSVQTAEGELQLLKNVDFSIEKGEIVAIVGPSGSGKSTLLSLLAGLDVPSSGCVRLMGTDLGAGSEDERARVRKEHVSFIFQSFQLLSHLSAKENVEFGQEIQGKKDERRVMWALEQVGLLERQNHYPKTLSGGEQQRVALARALAVTPKVLFADEPTGSLDQATGERVEKLLFSLCKEQGCTLVLVTHDMRLAQKADRIFTMQAGVLTCQ